MNRYSLNDQGELVLDPQGTLDESGNPIQTNQSDPQDTPGNDPLQPPPWLLMANRAADFERENARLREELERRSSPSAPTGPVFAEGELYTNPDKLINVLNDRINSQMRPVNEFIAQQNRFNVYRDLKNQVRGQNPAFAQIEHLVDQRMQAQEPTMQNLLDSVTYVVGQLALSGAFNPAPAQQTSTPAPQNNSTTATPHMPAHLRPSMSRTPGPAKQETDYSSQMTEEELRLAREQRISHKAWVMLRDTPPHKLNEVYAQMKKDGIV